MKLDISYEAAKMHHLKLQQTSSAYTEITLPSIQGSNTPACNEAETIRSEIIDLLSQYSSVAARDAEHIELLASYFKETDEYHKSKISTFL
ncbi:MAG: TIGR04197 family type VII secretion effector [Roseburia sp.]|nr:TIGR04197 family type VII secretion effector [Roseburia sp.]